MDGFKDLNELITVARQINEGKYDLIDFSLDPGSELVHIAKYFSESIKKLQSISSIVAESYNELPIFESTLRSVIDDTQRASEDVLGFVDKINFNIDDIKETLEQINIAVEDENFNRTKGLLERLKDTCVQGCDISFDIITSLEFNDISQQKVNEVLDAVSGLENGIAQLVIALGLKKQTISADTLDKLKEPKEILQDQTLVNQLLKEFGM
ncbi:MAG: protein phosphatase CheZ [Deferribacteraceae bacterium]|jgi:chemotaxis protein CheZ|nr:protein phosphatase CheZ [Deferribacteraceae bacterium]